MPAAPLFVWTVWLRVVGDAITPDTVADVTDRLHRYDATTYVENGETRNQGSHCGSLRAGSPRSVTLSRPRCLRLLEPAYTMHVWMSCTRGGCSSS